MRCRKKNCKLNVAFCNKRNKRNKRGIGGKGDRVAGPEYYIIRGKNQVECDEKIPGIYAPDAGELDDMAAPAVAAGRGSDVVQ